MTKTTKTKTARSKRKNVERAHVYVRASFNNTIVTIADENGDVLVQNSAGSSGFKGTRKSTPYAAQVAAGGAIKKALNFGVKKVDVYIKGLGSGREQALRGLQSEGGLEILSITDVTPVPHGGCRPKKMRRI
ncbi:30S ribosomal protein S11 [Candidatus Peregrinibacteria bacterium CG08_land_8_20_14_0_20_41_10]|nr:MAG: 30S ribosomal protein S11 [Candidatus Peregrinibacteria bacterium CG1_02_41_10]PIS32220.1 MAG: 30S ribosomal protein S11 [Candidatus Peregrinibacteria bacterium CG08_land_8_20_14_0_20_41_10]